MASEQCSKEDSGDEEEEQVALVEYVPALGQARKWTLELGQTYTVGRKESGADIEINHPTMSRRQCSLAVTKTDSELVLVMVDPGSTNGTFVDKRRLEKGVGLKRKLTEFRFMSFGECENGYKFLVCKGAGASRRDTKRAAADADSCQNKRSGPLNAHQKAQIERLKKLAAADRAAASRGESEEAGGELHTESAGGGNRRERRRAAAAARASGSGRNSRSRSPAHGQDDEWKRKADAALKMGEARKRAREGGDGARQPGSRRDRSSSSWRSKDITELTKGRTPAAESASIEWPEDWR